MKSLTHIPNKSLTNPGKYQLINLVLLLLICSLSTILALLLNGVGIGKENILMLFLVGVLFITVLTKGYLYSIIASTINVVIFNYFFAEPIFSLKLTNSQDITLLFFSY